MIVFLYNDFFKCEMPYYFSDIYTAIRAAKKHNKVIFGTYKITEVSK